MHSVPIQFSWQWWLPADEAVYSHFGCVAECPFWINLMIFLDTSCCRWSGYGLTSCCIKFAFSYRFTSIFNQLSNSFFSEKLFHFLSFIVFICLSYFNWCLFVFDVLDFVHCFYTFQQNFKFNWQPLKHIEGNFFIPFPRSLSGPEIWHLHAMICSACRLSTEPQRKRQSPQRTWMSGKSRDQKGKYY